MEKKEIASIGGWNPGEKMTKEYAMGVIDSMLKGCANDG